MTPSIDQTLHQFANLLPNWTLLPILTFLPNFGGFHRTLQRVRLANRGRLLLRTPGPVPFGTCICSNVETILSWTCYVYGPFEFRTSLGTSILLFIFLVYFVWLRIAEEGFYLFPGCGRWQGTKSRFLTRTWNLNWAPQLKSWKWITLSTWVITI